MTARSLVIALRPNDDLSKRLLAAKGNLHAACGTQTYLDHPPHATLFVTSVADDAAALAALQSLAAPLPAPRLESLGWKVFENDALTGGHTVVCELSATTKAGLRPVQRLVLERLAPFVDLETARRRYAANLAKMPVHRQQAVEQFGFPFVGDDWEPHLTVASIRPADWEAGWTVLRDAPIRGEFTCGALQVFELRDGFPCEFATFEFAN